MNGDHLSEAERAMKEQQEQFDWDRWAANVLLTVQALQKLHEAFDKRFTR